MSKKEKDFTEKDLTDLVRGFGMPAGESLERKVKESVAQEQDEELHEEISPIDSLKSQFDQDSIQKKKKRER